MKNWRLFWALGGLAASGASSVAQPGVVSGLADAPLGIPAPSAKQIQVHRLSSPDRVRAHQLWGVTWVDALDRVGIEYAYGPEGKQEVLDMWEHAPTRVVRNIEGIQTLVRAIPLESAAGLTDRQRAALLDTTTEFIGLNMLPRGDWDWVDRLIAFHTARGGKANFDNTLKTYQVMAPSDGDTFTGIRELLHAVSSSDPWGATWTAICPQGCLISVRRITDAGQVFDFNARNPFGTRRVRAARGGSVYFDAVRTLEEALQADGDALIAEITLLVQRNRDRLQRSTHLTYPILLGFHWEASVANWVYDLWEKPSVRVNYGPAENAE